MYIEKYEELEAPKLHNLWVPNTLIPHPIEYELLLKHEIILNA